MTKSLYLLGMCLVLLSACKTTTNTTAERPGCTDKEATNYESWATKDNGSCIYNTVVTDVFCTVSDLAGLTMGMTKGQVVSALGIYPYDILNSADGCEVHVYHMRRAQQELDREDADLKLVNNSGTRVYTAGIEEVSIYFKGGGLSSILTEMSETTLPHELACMVNGMSEMCTNSEDYVVCAGCTNNAALNFDPEAEEDDGSCMFKYGCTDKDAYNYDSAAVLDNGNCAYIGCTDENAVNFNPDALHSQKLCEYCPCDTEEFTYVKSDNPNCGTPCLAIPRENPSDAEPCTWCKLLDGNGNAAVQITVNGASLNDN